MNNDQKKAFINPILSTSLNTEGCGYDGLFSTEIPEIKYENSEGALEKLRSLLDDFVDKTHGKQADNKYIT